MAENQSQNFIFLAQAIVYGVLCFTFEIGTKCDKSEDWEKEKGRELKKETEYSFPASSCSMYGDQAQDNPKGWDTDSVGNVGLPIELIFHKFDFETYLVEAKHGKESPSEDAAKETSPGKHEAGSAF